MDRTLNVTVVTKPMPLSRAAILALRKLERYDIIAFTSKSARQYFDAELRKRGSRLPKKVQVLQVGPRNKLLRYPIDKKRILFPRSAIAPADIIRRLRARGAMVRVVPLYTTLGAPLSRADRKALETKKITKLYFRSASGVAGFLSQLRGSLRKHVLTLPLLVIGESTAETARKAGFRSVKIVGVL